MHRAPRSSSDLDHRRHRRARVPLQPARLESHAASQIAVRRQRRGRPPPPGAPLTRPPPCTRFTARHRQGSTSPSSPPTAPEPLRSAPLSAWRESWVKRRAKGVWYVVVGSFCQRTRNARGIMTRKSSPHGVPPLPTSLLSRHAGRVARRTKTLPSRRRFSPLRWLWGRRHEALHALPGDRKEAQRYVPTLPPPKIPRILGC
jgi:hypothetical protein